MIQEHILHPFLLFKVENNAMEQDKANCITKKKENGVHIITLAKKATI